MNTVLLRCLLIVLLIGVVVWGIGFSSAFEKILRPAGTAKNLTVTFLEVALIMGRFTCPKTGKTTHTRRIKIIFSKS